MVGAGVLFGLFIGAASWVLLLAPGPHDSARQIMIARGQSLDSVTRELAASGVLRSALVFSVYSRFAGPVQAGEFDLPPRASMRDISRILRVGDVVMHAITVPEGLTSQQVVELLLNEPVLSGAATIPDEGSLLPETYYVPRGHARVALLNKMQAAQKKLSRNYGKIASAGCRFKHRKRRWFWPQSSKRKPVRPVNAGKWPRCLSIVCESACDCNRIRRLFTVWWAAKVHLADR